MIGQVKMSLNLDGKKNYTTGVCNNLGMPCGSLNDVIVVDLDIYN